MNQSRMRRQIVDIVRRKVYLREREYAACTVLEQAGLGIIIRVDDVVDLVGNPIWVQLWDEIKRMEP